MIRVLLFIALQQTVALGQARGDEKPSGPVFHLMVSGDIECSQDARGIRSVIEEATAARAALLVIAFSGNNSRADLIWEVGKDIRESRIPIGVFLADPADREVGAGQLCLGLLAGSCAVAPGTMIRGTPNTPALALLAPEATHWDSLASEVSGWLQSPKAAHHLADGLAPAIVLPGRAAWAIFDGGGARVSFEKPGPREDSRVLVAERSGTGQLAVDSATLVRLKLVEEAPQWTALVTGLGIKGSTHVERAFTAGLAQPAQRIKPLLDRVESDDDQLRAVLKLPWPASKKVSGATYREAAAKARPKLDDAASAIVELEKLLGDYPELMRRPAPDQTGVGNKPSAFAARWRSLVQSRKDRIAKLQGTSEKFAQVKD